MFFELTRSKEPANSLAEDRGHVSGELFRLMIQMKRSECFLTWVKLL